MLSFDQEMMQEHMYGSESPIDWILLTRGIAYWVNKDDNSQLHLIGNIFLWYSSLFAMFGYSLLFAFYLIRRKRNFLDLPNDVWNTIYNTVQICVLAYVFHLIPYFFTDRPLFLHHYLPCVVFKLIVFAAFVEAVETLLRLQHSAPIVHALLIVCALAVFSIFLPFSFGDGALTAMAVNKMKWKQTWQFIIHKI